MLDCALTTGSMFASWGDRAPNDPHRRNLTMVKVKQLRSFRPSLIELEGRLTPSTVQVLSPEAPPPAAVVQQSPNAENPTTDSGSAAALADVPPTRSSTPTLTPSIPASPARFP